jgi:hypothetical protein
MSHEDPAEQGGRMRIETVERDGEWVARARNDETGDVFGIECAALTEADATARLTRWLDWQREHAAALDALQQAEHAYHRTIAGSAFASVVEGPSPMELQKAALQAIEDARVRLDDVRSQKPE